MDLGLQLLLVKWLVDSYITERNEIIVTETFLTEFFKQLSGFISNYIIAE